MIQAEQLRSAFVAEAAAAELPKGEWLRVAQLAGAEAVPSTTLSDAAQAKRGREPAEIQDGTDESPCSKIPRPPADEGKADAGAGPFVQANVWGSPFASAPSRQPNPGESAVQR